MRDVPASSDTAEVGYASSGGAAHLPACGRGGVTTSAAPQAPASRDPSVWRRTSRSQGNGHPWYPRRSAPWRVPVPVAKTVSTWAGAVVPNLHMACWHLED